MRSVSVVFNPPVTPMELVITAGVLKSPLSALEMEMGAPCGFPLLPIVTEALVVKSWNPSETSRRS